MARKFNFAIIGILFIGLFASVVTNINVYKQISQKNFMIDIESTRSKINNDELNELLITYINDQNKNNTEIIRGQGRQEALSIIAAKLPVEEYDVSALYHAGYQSGYDTGMLMISSIVENIDERLKKIAQITKANNNNNIIHTSKSANASNEESDLIKFWEISKQSILGNIENIKAKQPQNSSNWGKMLIEGIRNKEIELMLEEARLEGYHKATEDGVCTHKPMEKNLIKK